jgi:hypothetical protein
VGRLTPSNDAPTVVLAVEVLSFEEARWVFSTSPTAPPEPFVDDAFAIEGNPPLSLEWNPAKPYALLALYGEEIGPGNGWSITNPPQLAVFDPPLALPQGGLTVNPT